jgi:acyl-CoA hydrolase
LSEIEFTTRKWVRPEDLNANGTLFGGSLLRWIDEEATIHAILQLGNRRVVTKFMSEINFIASAIEGDLIEMGLVPTKFGTTSITMRAEVRNMVSKKNILTVDRIVFVGLDSAGVPLPHGYDSPIETACRWSTNRKFVKYTDNRWFRFDKSSRLRK